MTKDVPQSPTEHYIVPARQLSGTRDEVLAQIDDLVVGLTGLRQLVSMHGPTSAETPRRKLRLVRGFLKVLLLFSSVLCVSPAQAQTPAPSPSQCEIQPAEGSVTQQTSDP